MIDMSMIRGGTENTGPTVEEFLNREVYYPDYTYCDLAGVAQGDYLANEKTAIKDKKIAIIGLGAAGLAILSELTELHKKGQLTGSTLTIFDYEPDKKLGVYDPDNEELRSKYGRMYATKPKDGAAWQEIGCMRFPNIAKLTWTFVARAFADDNGDPPKDELTLFPNVGRVNSQFMFRDINLYFINDKDVDGNIKKMPLKEKGKDLFPKDENDLKLLNEFPGKVIGELLSSYIDCDSLSVPVRDGDGWKMVDKTRLEVLDFAAIYVEQDKPASEAARVTPAILKYTAEQKNIVAKAWSEFINKYDVSLLSVVTEAIRNVINENQFIIDYIKDYEYRDESYFIELFGRIGFGTGGFRPLNNVSFMDIVRLFIWDYSNEYLFPGNIGTGEQTNAELGNKILEQAKKDHLLTESTTSDSGYNEIISQKVIFVGKKGENTTESSDNGKVDIITLDEAAKKIKTYDKFDYVFIATSHHAAQKMVEPFAGNGPDDPLPSDMLIPVDIDLAQNELSKTDEEYYHPLDAEFGGYGKVYSALKRLHMMRSTKFFMDFVDEAGNDADYTGLRPQLEPDYNQLENSGDELKCIITDTDLSATYILPTKEPKTRSCLVAYNWGDEASNDSTALWRMSGEAGALNTLGEGNESYNGTIATRHAKAALRSTGAFKGSSLDKTEFWFSNLLEAQANNPGFMYDWSRSPETGGGFKLDWAGEAPLSDALAKHYRNSVRYAEKLGLEGNSMPRKKANVFLAGCSMSHYGGWLEGAFTTAVCAVAGFCRSELGEAGLTQEVNDMFLFEGEAVDAA